jgi:hypothetical protein
VTPKPGSSNPCPMLRALVAGGHLPAEGARAGAIASIAARLAGTPDRPDRKIAVLTWLVAIIANGLNMLTIMRTLRHGVRFDQLRDGPLDKHGVGSGVLDATGAVDAANLDRLDQFASDKINLSGTVERGLDAAELVTMMEANFARARNRRRAIDRRLMDGEFPLLLTMMGKDGRSGRYLNLAELRTLISDQHLPSRVTARLNTAEAA